MIIDIVVFKFIILLFASLWLSHLSFFSFSLFFFYDEFLSFHFISTFALLATSDFIFLVIAPQFTVSSVQSLSHVQLFATPWTTAHQASLSITRSQSLLKLISIESEMPSKHLILCLPLLFLPSIFSSIRVFSNESVLPIRWPKYWSFSFNISPFNEHSGLISFRMDWLDFLAVQGTLKNTHI